MLKFNRVEVELYVDMPLSVISCSPYHAPP
jgi:hypothetical protein